MQRRHLESGVNSKFPDLIGFHHLLSFEFYLLFFWPGTDDQLILVCYILNSVFRSMVHILETHGKGSTFN